MDAPERLGKMRSAADHRTRSAQALYKKYNDKYNRVTKRFSAADMIFIDHPKHKQNTAKAQDEQIAKSKQLTKSNGTLKGLRAYKNVIVIEQDGTKLPDSVDR